MLTTIIIIHCIEFFQRYSDLHKIQGFKVKHCIFYRIVNFFFSLSEFFVKFRVVQSEVILIIIEITDKVAGQYERHWHCRTVSESV